MDFGKLFGRAWEMLWQNLFLILMGVVVVLGGSGSGFASQSRFAFQGGNFPGRDFQSLELEQLFQSWDIPSFAVAGIFLFTAAILLFGLVFWALGLITRGGMITAVDDLDGGRETNFVTGFQAGWEKGWKLLGIGLVPAIPGFILMIIVITTLVFSGSELFAGEGFGSMGIPGFAPLLFTICIFVPIMMFVSALQTFANRACMLEDKGVIASYRRGLEVLGDNLGPVLILFLLQVVINIALGIIFVIPGILAAMCCFLWPLLLFVQAAFVAFYSILWTLAWRDWTGGAIVTA